MLPGAKWFPGNPFCPNFSLQGTGKGGHMMGSASCLQVQFENPSRFLRLSTL
jgi:hypothetical protein